MKINRFVALALIAVIAVAVLSMVSIRAFAQTSGPDDDELEDENEGPDVPITGDALEKASAVALEYVGEGRVTDTEVGDEEGYYEIEITLDDGRQIDVHLDEDFNVLSQITDEAEDD